MSAFASFLESHDDVARAATRGDSDGDIRGARLGDQLPKEDEVCANVVGNSADVGGLERKRDSGHRVITSGRSNAVDRPVVRVRGRATIAENDQLAAASNAVGNS